MNLHEYLNTPGSLTASELAARIGLRSAAQIWQWKEGHNGRLPGTKNCVAIEQATMRVVMRWDLRPDDWHLMWPELIQHKNAPKLNKATKRLRHCAPANQTEQVA